MQPIVALRTSSNLDVVSFLNMRKRDASCRSMVQNHRKDKKITPESYYKQYSVTGFYTAQEVLKARREHKPLDDELLRRIAGEQREMFGKALATLSSEAGALARVRADYERLRLSNWKVRPTKAKVVRA